MRVFILSAVALLSCGPPSPRTDQPRCAGAPERLRSAAADRADGYLFRALTTTRAAAACAPRDAGRLEAQLLADLGVDADATAAWRRFAAAPGATAADRAEADAAIAELARRPPAERAATPDERATALLLYRDGINLRLQKDYPGALRQLRRAYTLWPHPLTIVQIGAIHRAAGAEVEARRANERALAIAEATRKGRAVARVASGNIGFPSHLSVSADGARIVTIDGTAQLRVWDARTGRQALALELATSGRAEPRNEIIAADVDRHGSLAATVNLGGRVRAWSLDTGRLLREFPADESIGSVAQLPDGRLAIESAAGVRIEPRGGGPATPLPGAPPDVRALAHDADGAIVAALRSTNEVLVWRLDTGPIGKPTAIRLSSIASELAVAPDGQRIAVVIGQELVTLDRRTGATLSRVATDTWIGNIAFGPTGLLAAAVGDGVVQIWDGDKRAATVTTGAHETSLFAWTPDGAQLVTAADDWSLKVFEIAGGAGRELRTIAGLTPSLLRMELAADGHTLATSDITGRVTLRDLRTGAVLRTLYGHKSPALGLAFTPDGRRLVTGAIELAEQEPEMILWDPATGTALAGFAEEIELLVFSRDGRRLYSGRSKLGGGGDNGVWELGGDRFTRLDPESEASLGVDAVAASPTQDLVAGGHNDEIYLAPTTGPLGDPVVLRHDTDGDISVLAFSPDGTQLAAATETGPIHLWDVASRKFLRELPAAAKAPMDMRFTADGKRLAVAYFDGRVGMHDVATGAARLFRAHGSVVLGLQFTPAGHLLTCSMDGSVRIWDPLPPDPAPVATLLTGTDGRWLVVAADGRVDGSPGDEGGASLLSWQIGDVQFPGYVAWNRQHTPGLLRTLLSRATP